MLLVPEAAIISVFGFLCGNAFFFFPARRGRNQTVDRAFIDDRKMPEDRLIPTETSPLLGEQSNALPASTGAISNTDYHQSPANVQSEQRDQADAEAQSSKNVPMRYIFPVISIGVRSSWLLYFSGL